jgi:hypothetical protein
MDKNGITFNWLDTYPRLYHIVPLDLERLDS